MFNHWREMKILSMDPSPMSKELQQSGGSRAHVWWRPWYLVTSFTYLTHKLFAVVSSAFYITFKCIITVLSNNNNNKNCCKWDRKSDGSKADIFQDFFFTIVAYLFFVLCFGGFDGCTYFIMPSDRKMKNGERKSKHWFHLFLTEKLWETGNSFHLSKFR